MEWRGICLVAMLALLAGASGTARAGEHGDSGAIRASRGRNVAADRAPPGNDAGGARRIPARVAVAIRLYDRTRGSGTIDDAEAPGRPAGEPTATGVWREWVLSDTTRVEYGARLAPYLRMDTRRPRRLDAALPMGGWAPTAGLRYRLTDDITVRVEGSGGWRVAWYRGGIARQSFAGFLARFDWVF